MINRRAFIKYVSGTGFLYFAVGPDGLPRAHAQPLPGGALDPGAIPKYQAPLLVPPGKCWATAKRTRPKVHAAPAGAAALRGGPGDGIRDTRNGARAVLPGSEDLPGTGKFELPITIQDRSFKADGSLFCPDVRALFAAIVEPCGAEPEPQPGCGPEVFGNTMLVNGNAWPFQVVQQRRYRLRFLNSCQSRFLFLDLGAIPGIKVWQIGNEGGFLVAPVDITAHHGNRVLLGPAERADCIIDFSEVAVGEHLLRNVGPDEPFSGGIPDLDFAAADPGSTGQVLQFRVVPAASGDRSTPPQFLRLPALSSAPRATVTRRLALLEEMSMYFADSPGEPFLGVVKDDPGESLCSVYL